MSELDEWLGKQVDACAYAGDPRRFDLLRRLVRAHGTLRVLATEKTPERGMQVFGAVVPDGGVAAAAELAARARALLDGWIAALDPSARAALARELAPETCRELGLENLHPAIAYVAHLEVDVAVEVTDLDESSNRYDEPVRDVSDLARFDGTTTGDVTVGDLPFARAFAELGSFATHLAFDEPRGRLALRAVFGLTSMPDEARGARLMKAIGEELSEARTWMNAEWTSPTLGDAVHRYHVIVGKAVLGARVLGR